MSILNKFTTLAEQALHSLQPARIENLRQWAISSRLAFGPEAIPVENFKNMSLQDRLNSELVLATRSRHTLLRSAFWVALGADTHTDHERPLAEAAFASNFKLTRFLLERNAIVTNKTIDAAQLGKCLCEEYGDRKKAVAAARVE